MKFKYEGFNVGGQVTSGEVEAASREEAAENLRDAGLYVQQLKEVGVEEFKPVLPQKQKADDFTEGLGFKKIEPLRKPEESPRQEEDRKVFEELKKAEDRKVFESLKKAAEVKEEPKQEACTSCPEGCQCGEPEDLDEKLTMDIMHLMSAGTYTQMLMKSMYKDNPGMYDIMRELVQKGMGHALGQFLVESVVRRRKP